MCFIWRYLVRHVVWKSTFYQLSYYLQLLSLIKNIHNSPLSAISASRTRLIERQLKNLHPPLLKWRFYSFWSASSHVVVVSLCLQMAAQDEELPSELEEQCSECHKALAGVERLLKPLLGMNRYQVEEKVCYDLLPNACCS